MTSMIDDSEKILVQTPARKKRGGKPGLMIKTRTYFRFLKQIFEAPPDDYDGSNQKLAEYLQMSLRQTSRILTQMAKEGYIEIRVKTLKSPLGFHTHREILLLPKIKEI